MSSKEKQIKPHTDIKYFKNNKTYEEKLLKDCIIENTFVFKRIEFILCSKQKYYMVCVSKDGELFSVWNCPEEVNGSEVMSLFRKGMLKYNIDENLITTFITTPKKYVSKFKKLKL